MHRDNVHDVTVTMTKERWIYYGVIATLVITVILFITGIFGRRDRGNPYFDELIKAKDQQIEAEVRHREDIIAIIRSQDAKIDSLYSELSTNQPKYIINEKRLADIPAHYRDATKDDLRRRATGY